MFFNFIEKFLGPWWQIRCSTEVPAHFRNLLCRQLMQASFEEYILHVPVEDRTAQIDHRVALHDLSQQWRLNRYGRVNNRFLQIIKKKFGRVARHTKRVDHLCQLLIIQLVSAFVQL